MEAEDLKNYVIEPVLKEAELYSPAAVNLLLGTAAQESHMGHFFMQVGGPAIGIFQMEPATHDDIWANFLKYHEVTAYTHTLEALCYPNKCHANTMFWNLKYAALMCRVHYYRRPEPLPDARDLYGLASYWKAHYNTEKGAGTIDKFIENYTRYVK